MFDVATGHVLWERNGSGGTRFDENVDIVLHRDEDSKRTEFLEARTGKHKTHHMFSVGSGFVATADGRHFIISGQLEPGRDPFFWETWLEKHWPTPLLNRNAITTSVFETATGRERFRITDADDSLLSPDGETLVTVRLHNPEAGPLFWGELTIQAWDVAPTKAWFWAIGVAPTAALLWQFGVLRLVRAMRKRRKLDPKPIGVQDGATPGDGTTPVVPH
jgi:hypothetical protein